MLESSRLVSVEQVHQPPPLFFPSVHSSAFLHLRDVDEANKYPNKHKQENKLRDHPGIISRAPVFKDSSEKQPRVFMFEWLRFLRS